jgi:hypothetical protein
MNDTRLNNADFLCKELMLIDKIETSTSGTA